MKGNLIFISLSALLGIISTFEGMWSIGLFLLYLFWFLVKKIPKKQILFLTLVYILYFIVSSYFLYHNKTILPSEKTHFQVQFLDEMKIDGKSIRAVVIDSVSKEKLVLSYKIASESEKKILQNKSMVKNICILEGKLEIPSPSRNVNAFNYQEYLKQKNIFWELQVTNWRVENCRGGKINLLDKIKRFRDIGITNIERNFTKETAPLAAALIFGSREFLEEETILAYQKLGVIHLISISGLHVALLVGLIFYLGIRLGFVREKLSRILIMLLPVYAILTGASPSVNRSVIMTMMILAIINIKFPFILKSIDGLCLSFLLLTLINPMIIYNIGFQLSYIVTFSLLLSLSIASKIRSNFIKMMTTSYISQISALPFLLFHFYEIPLLSIVANMIFVPLYSFIFLPGLILIFVIQFLSNDLFDFLSLLLSFLIKKSDQLAEFISSFSWTMSSPGKPSVPFLILYLVSILLSFYSWEKFHFLRWRVVLPWMVLGAHLFSPHFSSLGEVTLLDVGQGDSILIKLPKNKGNYLIDTGGSLNFSVSDWRQRKNQYDVGHDVLVPFLKSKGINILDLLILTHGDMDHIGGSFALLKEIKVKNLLLPSNNTEKSSFEMELLKIAKEKNIKVTYVNEGMAWKINNNEFHILSPPQNYSGDKNEGSIVLNAKIGGSKWLFTGDLGKEGEQRIIENYPDITIDILKVGHHGSKNSTSKEFIEYFRPKYALISVGEQNRFGHPHPEVLKILEEEGSNILRTDRHGGITFYFKREKGTFYKAFP
ncbi:DNA internalization-related competence protein ComEC/Rec2 [Bacillus sp. CGMCC 1.16607]|uniref:DNA internalization-related competence protein ComEC/Rec2 n=1 Tax=Bacillus sp. CGMCC 1.16607 TaxID=3351842 RepID=UPI003642CB62